ncbi:3-hydroxybutyryl-CoA dehydrogenase [Priestia endophytica]|jgi:3-hydroxybutyryl-CoA dehydrogenase|uniref:3-hydroxybutyryl-CoA dehydrogenase n=1 Tax=Priestia endophytica DSM 13796 TaxID=1121089 RepID=A0A1I6BR84_9BACI|nr:3-hydroxybutyryl-CoA dehydrogenase [Priestia endophytica]KYG28589.1 3-hydroxybutyryl-CoA dehydrogenase [Priestia endophytica]MBG9811897.1 3-hydroxybutyryl-CoA dehydrogenase [Priestia endophytica]SFQ83440.1 3-hydroxybutyryl-CoA dehydrogenase [Priestia endophytica DSM 13796]
MENRKAMVIGTGQMGAGIAQVLASASYNVVLYDLDTQALQKGISKIETSLKKAVQKEKIKECEMNETLARIQDTTSLSNGDDADIVIEAIVENLEVKKEVFKKLDQIVKKEAILASNTSALSITELGSVTKRPEKVIGMHFMNPVPVMKLVEVIRGLSTSEETYKEIKSITESLGKVPVLVKDFPGFVSNRILMPMINEAIYALYEGIASKEAIDEVMKLGMNHPMGPLQLADFIGLDTCLFIMEVLHEGFGDDKYRPCPLLKQYVKGGYLGHKVKRGFYEYE